MKDRQSITLKGKEVKLAFTIGAMEDFQEHLKQEGITDGLEKALNEMRHLRKFCEYMTEYAGEKVSAEEFKFLDFSEIGKITDFIESATENIAVGKPQKAKK